MHLKVTHVAWTASLLLLAASGDIGTHAAHAQACDLDAASCPDAASMRGPDAGAEVGTDAGAGSGADASTLPSDGGAQPDASSAAGDGGALDSGQPDGGSGPALDGGAEVTSACSCETALESDGRIHVCTGSFEAAVCSQFSCDDGTVRPSRCPATRAVLCCQMPERGLYSHLYSDCTHANCESGFIAQCQDFGGSVIEGSCEAPEEADDPETELGNDSTCSVSAGSPGASSLALALFGLGAYLAARRRRAAFARLP